MKQQIIFPMLAYVLYMGCLSIYMFTARLNAIRGGKVSIKYFKTYSNPDVAPPPERAVVIARHYDNQFQVPILFLMACTLHFSIGMIDTLTLILAWAFVASRAFHGWVHLGSNNVIKRATAFGVGWLLLILIWIQLGYFAIKMTELSA